ncbi:MAG: hypothetical protein V1897_04045, partial [Pseudomonadota bacterium]
SFEARESSLTEFHPAEKCVEGFLQPPENILTRRIVQDRELRESIAQFLKLSGLVVIVQREFAGSPRIASLFKSEVVKSSSSIKQSIEPLSLNACRVETIFERSSQGLYFSRKASIARRTSSETDRPRVFLNFRKAEICLSER